MNIAFTPFDFKHSPAKRVATEYSPQRKRKNKNMMDFGEEQQRKNFFRELPSRMSIGTVNDKH